MLKGKFKDGISVIVTVFNKEEFIEEIESRGKENIEEKNNKIKELDQSVSCLLYTSPSPRDATLSRMPSSA